MVFFCMFKVDFKYPNITMLLRDLKKISQTNPMIIFLLFLCFMQAKFA